MGWDACGQPAENEAIKRGRNPGEMVQEYSCCMLGSGQGSGQRFWTKVLYDAGMITFNEPFRQLRNQGMMLAYTPGRRPREDESSSTGIDWIVLKPEERDSFPEDQIVWRWAKMSKSKYNGIDPEQIIARVGADKLRLYILFVAPFEVDVRWSEEGLIGAVSFVKFVLDLLSRDQQIKKIILVQKKLVNIVTG